LTYADVLGGNVIVGTQQIVDRDLGTAAGAQK